ncbi:MAG: hypothetical protein KBD26_02660 [Candidatus Pacebacteria bacterium]|nr:hypothetical protein [Candidatus Paceibacterota bacterium]MBP9772712.1 hypothetical protein [Candidatus Paceibacterota bacterium]QQR76694.1 MAG: hypothetical protein IPJ63_00265 [Candidatus Nomurabacteria bacterium]
MSAATNVLTKSTFAAKRLMVVSKKMRHGSVSVFTHDKGWNNEEVPFFIDPRAIDFDLLVVLNKNIKDLLTTNQQATFSFKFGDKEYLATIISYRLQVTERLIAEILPIFKKYHDDNGLIDRIKIRESVFVQIRLADLERL